MPAMVAIMRIAPLAFPIILIVAAASYRPAAADVAEILGCASQADDKARLACYDSAAAKLKTEVAEAKEKEKERGKTLFGLPIPFTGSQTEEDFGKPPSEPPEMKEVTEISAKVSGWTKDPLGRAVLILDNGQVWKVMEYKPVMISTAGSTTVRIERRAMGGYYMSVNGADSNLTVTRLK